MRKRPPRLSVPDLVRERRTLELLGSSPIRTIGRRQETLAKEKNLGRKRRLVEGNWNDGTAGYNLMTQLGLEGQFRDATFQGTPEGSLELANLTVNEDATFNGFTIAQNDFHVPGTITSGTIVNGGDLQTSRKLIVGDPFVALPSIAATPVATYPGAGTTPTVNFVGSDSAGEVEITIGTTPALGNIFRVTFGTAHPNTSYAIVFSPTSNQAAVDMAKIRCTKATTDFLFAAVGAALTAGAVYRWEYVIMRWTF